MDQSNLENARNVQLFKLIRERPALYIGARSLSALSSFLLGYEFGLRVHGIHTPHLLPPDFNDWVAYRLHFFESTNGYRKMIMKRVSDESLALDRFFELLDELHGRSPKIVAIVQGHWVQPKRSKCQEVEMNEVAERPLETLSLVTYTEDPGFFVSCNDGALINPWNNQFYPTLRSFTRQFAIRKENLRMIDSDTYNRWLEQEDRFDDSVRFPVVDSGPADRPETH